jgi:hypothetical protein
MLVLDLTGQRQHLSDAVYDAAEELTRRGYDENMVGICAGGLIFFLSGEDGYSCSDGDILNWINNPAALELALYIDLREGWQGFDNDEEKAARDIVKTVARHFSERGRSR